MADIINSTPNASIPVPSTSYKMRKFVTTDLTYEFHVKCPACNIYSTTLSAKCKCTECERMLTTVESEYFIYIPIKQQLIKSINENFARINSYLSECNTKEGIISDVFDSILHRKARTKYQNATVLSLVLNLDGARVHKCSGKSLWPMQFYQYFLPPYGIFLKIYWLQKSPICMNFYPHYSTSWIQFTKRVEFIF